MARASIDRCSSRGTQKTHNLELGGGSERGDGGQFVIGIEEHEKQVSSKRWQNTLRSTARSSKLVVKIVRIESACQLVHVEFLSEQVCFHKFPNTESTCHEHCSLRISFVFATPQLSTISFT